ncbi:MAG: TspO/MBR family protein [Armatimonadota bacterium]
MVCEGVGVVGSVFTSRSVANWYALLRKPNFNPPNYVFAPVWTVLYLLMGISAALIWHKGLCAKGVRIALLVFLLQLGLNVAWSMIFFGLRSPGAAFLELVLLWLVVFATLILFYRISVCAGLLLVPYILWISFAAVLNYSIWRLN